MGAILSAMLPALLSSAASNLPALISAIPAIAQVLTPTRAQAASKVAQAATQPLPAGVSAGALPFLQQALNALTGANLTVDGKWGPSTEAALVAGLEQLGVTKGSPLDALIQDIASKL
jgi:peptidoglycan hydrolase-like protein with peptidoglycan-binding domain